ncbi:hypothetical protein [Caballeronia sp. Lep1P3]|uniref:hypothetical protein n=1 Tax=Caballeronia sp. Lep1P3 TaxID=2878150 RepID=UPI001FD2BB75|nr:hypothetical protein [Caballeronia sp. Lep1P3]
MQIFLLRSMAVPILGPLVVVVRRIYRVSSTSSYGGLNPSLEALGFFFAFAARYAATLREVMQPFDASGNFPLYFAVLFATSPRREACESLHAPSSALISRAEQGQSTRAFHFWIDHEDVFRKSRRGDARMVRD